MKVGIIYARARNGVIGKDGLMPWHMPEDLAHFRQVTMGCPVIMGRKTWNSLPSRFRPLPGRPNYVISRQTDFKAEGAFLVPSLEEALARCGAIEMAWVIGGAQIYAQAALFADVAEVTELDADFEGDAFAPSLAPTWVETKRSSHIAASGVRYSFVTLKNTDRGD